MDAYAVLRVKTKKTELVYTGRSLSLEPRKHSLSDVVELSPEERLALFRLILEVQKKGQDSLKWTVKELAGVCDSNIASISTLILKLKGCGLIEPDIMRPTTHGGRTSYIVTSDCRHLLEQSAWLENYPIRALQRRVLLPEEGYNPEKQKRGGFSRSNRWLLAVLLEYSDLMGVVDELGGAELRSLTGFTKERLRVQLRQLNALGFLHAVVPGISGHPLFGLKPSVYYVNLHHPYFACSRFSGLSLLISSNKINDRNIKTDFEQLKMYRREELSNTSKLVVQFDSVKKLNSFTLKNLMGKSSSPDFQRMESVVGRLSSLVLNEFWNLLHQGKKINSELLEKRIDGWTKKRIKTEQGDYQKQVEVLIDLSIHRAREIQTVLINAKITSLSEYKYLLLPVGYYERRPRLNFFLEVFPKQKNNKGFKCLSIKTGSSASCDETEELTVEQRYAFGFIDEQMFQKVKALGMPVFASSSTSDSPET